MENFSKIRNECQKDWNFQLNGVKIHLFSQETTKSNTHKQICLIYN